jgi:hypothetical protein
MSNPAQDFRRRVNELSDEPATSWRPKPGDVLVGTLLDIDLRSTKFDESGRTPVLTIREDETGELIECWALHTVLRGELAKRRPQVGERIAVRRLTDSGQGYKRYKVLVDRDKPAAFSWDAVSTDAGDVAPEDRPKLMTQTGDVVELPAPAKPASPFDDDDSDMPF